MLSYDCFEQHVSADQNLYPSALGILHTYTKLVEYHTDFLIAIELSLLPSSITWRQWSKFRNDLVRNIIRASQVNQRYYYGELRLSRLNGIYCVYCHSWRRGYFLIHTSYQNFFRTNFGWLLLAFAYISVVLSAFQVLLSADQSQGHPNAVLERMSIGVGTASTTGVLVAVSVIVALFIILRTGNKVYTRSRKIEVHNDSLLHESFQESMTHKESEA